ncbi:sugar transferase [Streptomyces sp. NBC_00237]|uniref:sugar transferase n=1 Tax=Streptomyces sp. NBC_00237 TaxID=2975687 RepID=UPI00225B2FBE|nr:sugar transferase [Streptomyces sp. NBC_00237]MCX5200255.1 sugar transferase [Streptomyces sp. NBC_00237]
MRAPSAKRALDLTGSLLLLLLLAPVLAVCAAAVALTSPGGAFFRQARAGRLGEPFEMLKFRTMRASATAERAALAARNDSDGHLFKMLDDPRVTPVGRVLRRFSLDELPQLVNVVRGEMSLVGPRPLPVEDSGYQGLALGRLKALPGMTGLWQVSGRSDLPWDEMVLLDLDYVDRHCLALDLTILARTVPAVLTARGAR